MRKSSKKKKLSSKRKQSKTKRKTKTKTKNGGDMQRKKILNDLKSPVKGLKFPADFVLKSTAKQKRYNKKLADSLSGTNLHYGQLKLLLSEMEVFLLPKAKHIKYVVYAGAAPGIHISVLAKFLPNIQWYLYDPRPVFDKSLAKFAKIKTHVQFFTKSDAKKLRKKLSPKKGELMLISDIRSNTIEKAKKRNNLDQQQEIVFADMNLQSDFYDELKPDMSLFKFRLNWTEGKTTYYDGRIFYPIYGKYATTEFRLYVNGPSAKSKKYDNRKYEDQCFYFNYCVRNQTDWDRKATHTILDAFSKKYKITKKTLMAYIIKILFT